MQTKKVTLNFHSRDYNGLLQIIIKNIVDNRELVWPTLIRQNNVLVDSSPIKPHYTTPHIVCFSVTYYLGLRHAKSFYFNYLLGKDVNVLCCPNYQIMFTKKRGTQ